MVIEQVVAGAAALTSSASSFTASVPGTGQTFTVASATGYPSSGAFTVQLDRGLASEEKILCSGRSGTTFTVGTRGYDGTTAQSHTNPTVNLILPATVVNALIDHVDGVELAPHSTTLPVGTTTGHDTTTRHVFGAGNTALGVPGTPTTIAPDDSGSAGTGARAAREDHRHAITTATAGYISADAAPAEGSAATFARSDHTHGITTAVALSIGTALSEGVLSSFSRSDHIHELGAGSIDTAAFFANNVIPLAAIPDGLITLAKLASEDPTSFAPSAGSFSSNNDLTVGTGGTTYGYVFAVGLLRVGWCGFRMESDGNVPSGSAIRVPLPFTQKALTSLRGFVAARTRADSGSGFSATGFISSGNNFGSSLITAGASALWDATTPYNWGAGGVGSLNFDAVFFGVSST